MIIQDGPVDILKFDKLHQWKSQFDVLFDAGARRETASAIISNHD